MSGWRSLCSLCDAIGNFIAFCVAAPPSFGGGEGRGFTGRGKGQIARFVDSFFILNTEADREPQWATEIRRRCAIGTLRNASFGLTDDRGALARRSGGPFTRLLCKSAPAGRSSAVRGGHCRSAVAPNNYPGIRIVPVPLLVLDTQLRNYQRMIGCPANRLPNIHLLRLRNGLRRFVG
jgi:hypothetical protein